MTQPILASDDRFSGGRLTDDDIRHLAIEDETPVDNFQSEKQQRLLVGPIYSTQAIAPPFLIAANVGVFYDLGSDPIVPDVFLSLGVQCADDFSQRKNRSYFVREFGKVPDVCIEVVSNAEGDEVKLSRKSEKEGKTCSKKDLYTQIQVPYYVVFDPLKRIQKDLNGALLRVWVLDSGGDSGGDSGNYVELTSLEGIRTVGEFIWLDRIGLGLTIWEGPFEDEVSRLWVRWCDRSGAVIPTGDEGQALAQQRANEAQQQADLEQQRADLERQRANAEQQRANAEQQRADEAQRLAERLAERLRSLGLDPDDL